MRVRNLMMAIAIIMPNPALPAPIAHARAATAVTPPPKIIAVTPVNGTESIEPVTEVGVRFAGDAALGQIQLEQPDGTFQIVFEKSETPFIGTDFHFALRQPAAQPGLYHVHYVAWSLDGKSSASGVFTFVVAAPANAMQIEQ